MQTESVPVAGSDQSRLLCSHSPTHPVCSHFPFSTHRLSRSLSLVLEEFYQAMTTVGVSAVTGEGMDEFFEVSRVMSWQQAAWMSAIHAKCGAAGSVWKSPLGLQGSSERVC